MKKKQLDNVHTLVCQLCATLRDDTVSLTRLSDLLDCVIELARTGHTLEAISINREVMSFLAEGHSRSVQDARQKAWADSVKAQPGSSIGSVGEKNVWWKAGEINIRTTQPSVTGYVGIRHDAPKPVATVEQMRAAADAAMASDEDLTEWTCDVCRKKTLTESMTTPIGWFRTLNSNTGKALYACNECQMFGIKNDAHVHDGAFTCSGCSLRSWTADGKGPLGWVFNAEVDGKFYKVLCTACFGTGILKQYNCRDCDSTTRSRVHPAPGWTDVGDGEFICFACAEEEAEP